MEQRGHIEWNVRHLVNKRNLFPKKEVSNQIINENQIKSSIRNLSLSSAVDTKDLLSWLQKMVNYIPISSEKELEETIRVMIRLSEERARLNYLYDKPGIELMKRVRDYMASFFVVLSELRANQEEYFPFWHLEEYWIFEWCHILLNLLPNETMENYGFPQLKARELVYLLALELACADSATKLEAPIIRMHASSDLSSELMYIPTAIAAEEYKITVSRILNKTLTFTEWIREMQSVFKLPMK